MNKRLIQVLLVAMTIVSLSIPAVAPSGAEESDESKIIIENKAIDLTQFNNDLYAGATKEILAPHVQLNPLITRSEDCYKVSKKCAEEQQRDIVLNSMNEDMLQLDDIEDKQEWFITYKDIVEKYSDVLDPPESIYDYYSNEELEMFFRVVQAEIGDEYSFEQKCNVASVILNRVDCNEGSFATQNTLTNVLTSDQFATISNGRYKKVEVSETTILACEYVFMFGSTTDALFFDSDGSLSYKLISNDGAHNFYGIN